MTFSRPTIERLIATVESGLQYGELEPYAEALRNCLEELDRVTADLDHAASENMAFNLRVSGEINDNRRQIARLTAERDELQVVVDACGDWDTDFMRTYMRRLYDALVAYRAAKDRP